MRRGEDYYYHINLLIVIDNVQLAHTSKVLVQELHKVVDDLQGEQLVISFIWATLIYSLADSVEIAMTDLFHNRNTDWRIFYRQASDLCVL